jgi:hypothetical protein
MNSIVFQSKRNVQFTMQRQRGRRMTASNRSPLALSATHQVDRVLRELPNDAHLPQEAVRELMGLAFKRGATYIGEHRTQMRNAPPVKPPSVPRDSLMPKTAIRELMVSAFMHGASYEMHRRNGRTLETDGPGRS